MLFNDIKTKVNGRFFKEIELDSEGNDEVVYVFPDTKEFISILRRDMNKKLISDT